MAENTPQTPAAPLIEGSFSSPKKALKAVSTALDALGVESELSLDSSTSPKGTMSKAVITANALSPEVYNRVYGLASHGLKVVVLIEDPQSNTGWAANDVAAQLKALMS